MQKSYNSDAISVLAFLTADIYSVNEDTYCFTRQKLAIVKLDYANGETYLIYVRDFWLLINFWYLWQT